MPTPATPAPRSFATTRWTLVVSARDDSDDGRKALAELCEAYYAPIESFVAWTVRDPDRDRARELTHDFFARLLARPGFGGLERGRGRFRSYLLGALKHFLADVHDRESAARRGAGVRPLSLESGGGTATTPGAIEPPDPHGPPPDTLFDRAWALAVIERALAILADELRADGRTTQFETLKPWLTGNAVDLTTQADAAAMLGISEGAVKVAIHRLRRRFRELVRSEIAETVDGPEDIASELRYLIEVLS